MAITSAQFGASCTLETSDRRSNKSHFLFKIRRDGSSNRDAFSLYALHSSSRLKSSNDLISTAFFCFPSFTHYVSYAQFSFKLSFVYATLSIGG